MRFGLTVVWFMILSTRTSQPEGGLGKMHKLRSKGLNQVKLGPIPMTNKRIKTQADLRGSLQLVNNVPEQRRPELSQSQADCPRRGRPASNNLLWSHATATDLRRQSQMSTQRRWPDGRIPRPAGPTLQRHELRLCVEDMHTGFTCMQLMPSPVLTPKLYK